MAEKKAFGTIVRKDGEIFLKVEGQRDLVSLQHLISYDEIRNGAGTKVEVVYSAPKQTIAALVASPDKKKGTEGWRMLCYYYSEMALKNIVVSVPEAEADRVLRDMVRQGYISEAQAKAIGKAGGPAGVNAFK